MNAGVKASDAALAAFELVKTKKRDFVVFKINDNATEVVVDQIFPSSEDSADYKEMKSDADEKKREANFEKRVYPKFVAALTSVTNSARFAVLDFRWISEERSQDKLLFFFWCPEKTGVRAKMVAASTNQTFSAKLNIVAKLEVQDKSDIEISALIAKAQGK